MRCCAVLCFSIGSRPQWLATARQVSDRQMDGRTGGNLAQTAKQTVCASAVLRCTLAISVDRQRCTLAIARVTDGQSQTWNDQVQKVLQAVFSIHSRAFLVSIVLHAARNKGILDR
jgi:hypothetical protein